MSGSLRIAMVLASPGTTWGGMEKHTLELGLRLAQEGHEVHVIADGRYRERMAAAPFQFHPLPVHLSRRHPWLTFSLGRLLRRIQPDVGHGQGNKAAQLLSGPAGKACRATVGTVHGTKGSHRAFKRLDGVIAVSSAIAESLSHPRIAVIHNGAEAPEADPPRPPQMPSSQPGQPIAVAAGRLVPVKGFDNLLRAWSALPEDWRLVILGEGPERERLEQLGRSLGLRDRVWLAGYSDRVSDWLGHADACVISSHREGFPYLMVEALLARCPVLATPVSGVDEYLPDQTIAADSTPEALTSLLAHWLGQPEALVAAQQQAFARAAETLTLEAMAGQTMAFYRDCLSEA